MAINDILEIRILPPFVIGRLGSSQSPMDCYQLVIDDPVGPRTLRPAPTLVVDPDTGEIKALVTPERVAFRAEQQRVRPVAPFLELWARFEDDGDLVPLTAAHLAALDLTPAAVTWSVHVANIKAYRRTGDPNDRVEARATFADHAAHALSGLCGNFKAGKELPLGSVRYLKPTDAFPEIRLRFTPAEGKVYGPDKGDRYIADDVYDAGKGHWKGYADDDSNPRITIPGEIYATDAGGKSLGYLDDECDGYVEARLALRGRTLGALARVAVGPPTFAPDGLPVRTVHDELNQALLGPDVGEPVTDDEVKDIVRRALETVRLQNTEVLNRASTQRGVGMARMDYLDVHRAVEPIMDPSVVDAYAVRARHERVLLALESGTLAWFARVLRGHDQVGDLSDAGRRRMPALMRGADGRHLALTRRQVNIIREAARQLAAAPAPPAGHESPGAAR